MKINEIIHSQLEAAIAGLCRIRDNITHMKPDETQDIGRQIESAAFYLEDIQYNWASLKRMERSASSDPHSPSPVRSHLK